MSRIAIDARLTAYRTGGIAEYSRALIRELALLDAHSRYLILHARRATESLIPDDAPNFERVTMLTPCHHRIERLALGVETARLRLDLLHSPDFIPPRRLPVLGARLNVITIHDLNFLHYPQFQTPDSLRYYSGNIRAAVAQADHILADSNATKADICALLNVAPDRITVHPLGVDPAFRPLSAESITAARQRLNLPEVYILFVGTFEPRKNLSGLLAAYAVLTVHMPDAPPLLIVGRRGWLYESLFDQARSLGVENRVIWREDITDADRVALYNGATLLTLPSFYEGFGLPPLEAMACGVPVVGGNGSSIAEVVGNAGMLVEPTDARRMAGALIATCTEDDLNNRLRQRALLRAAQYTWQRTAFETYAVFHKVYKVYDAHRSKK